MVKRTCRSSASVGAPGPRPGIPGLYSAYVRDLDGNKLCVSYVPMAG